MIKRFEKATGAILNKGKTKIFGFGSWNNKIEWPIPWIQNSVSSFNSLGIVYSNDYQMAVNLNWENIISTVDTKVKIM